MQAKSFIRELNLILTRTKKCQAITKPQNIWICFVFKSTKEDISRNVFQKTISFPYRERQKRMHFRKCQHKLIQGFIDSTMTTVLYLPTEHNCKLLEVPLCFRVGPFLHFTGDSQIFTNSPKYEWTPNVSGLLSSK